MPRTKTTRRGSPRRRAPARNNADNGDDEFVELIHRIENEPESTEGHNQDEKSGDAEAKRRSPRGVDRLQAKKKRRTDVPASNQGDVTNDTTMDRDAAEGQETADDEMEEVGEEAGETEVQRNDEADEDAEDVQQGRDEEQKEEEAPGDDEEEEAEGEEEEAEEEEEDPQAGDNEPQEEDEEAEEDGDDDAFDISVSKTLNEMLEYPDIGDHDG